MKKLLAAAAVVAALTGMTSVMPASAAPPTATVSPGYDAALAASRSTDLRPTDVSSRRYYRRYRGYYGRRYYRPSYGYGYGNPYYGGGYYGRPYYGGGYGPGIGFRFGF